MRRVLAFLVTVSVVLWILPLGIFIKPGQEATACDGKRAFHMCSTDSKNFSKSSASSKVAFSNGSGFSENAKASGASGNDFLDANILINLSEDEAKYFNFFSLTFYPLIPSSVFHPPQNVLLF